MPRGEPKKDFAQTQHAAMERTIARSESMDDEPEGVILWGDTEPTKMVTLTRVNYPLRPLSPLAEPPAPTPEPLASQ